MLDGIFGAENLRNEVIWKRTIAKGLTRKRLPRNHDIILSYQKTNDAFWNEDEIFQPYDESKLDEKTAGKYCHRDKDGRLYRRLRGRSDIRPQQQQSARPHDGRLALIENEAIELRLLIQPIHRYNDAPSGLVDGSIFVFAHGTNPEIILFIECRDEPDGARAWFYGLARLSSAELVARLGEREVWRQPSRVNLSNPAEAYFSVNEPIPAREGPEP